LILTSSCTESAQKQRRDGNEQDVFAGQWVEIKGNENCCMEIIISKTDSVYIIKQTTGNREWFTAVNDNGILKGTEHGDIVYKPQNQHLLWSGNEFAKTSNK
jgi:hypothetical protein